MLTVSAYTTTCGLSAALLLEVSSGPTVSFSITRRTPCSSSNLARTAGPSRTLIDTFQTGSLRKTDRANVNSHSYSSLNGLIELTKSLFPRLRVCEELDVA